MNTTTYDEDNHLNAFNGSAAIAEMKRKAPEVVCGGYDLVEAHMIAGPGVMGETVRGCGRSLTPPNHPHERTVLHCRLF